MTISMVVWCTHAKKCRGLVRRRLPEGIPGAGAKGLRAVHSRGHLTKEDHEETLGTSAKGTGTTELAHKAGNTHTLRYQHRAPPHSTRRRTDAVPSPFG